VSIGGKAPTHPNLILVVGAPAIRDPPIATEAPSTSVSHIRLLGIAAVAALALAGCGASNSSSPSKTSAQARKSTATECDLNATPSSLAGRITQASQGQTICLATGDYGMWAGADKAVTIKAAPGAVPIMKLTLGSGARGFTLDGISGLGGTIGNGASNLTIRNSKFATQLNVEGGVRHILIDGNDFTYPVKSVAGGVNSKILVNTTGSSPGSAVRIEHNNIANGDLDGVHISGGSGELIFGNRIENLCDRGVNHTDDIQLESGTHLRIARNYLYEPQHCPTQGITSFDGGTVGVVIEDNVIDIPRDWGIELYSDKDSVVRHNTVVWHPTSYSEFRNGTGLIDIDRKPGDPAGTGTQVDYNIATVQFSNGSIGTQQGNVSGEGAKYVGPPTSWAGFKLAADSSVGLKAAPGGADAGAQIS
jgi:hypothetical protein